MKLPDIFTFRIEFRVTEACTLPRFKGSMVRGILGNALRDRFCLYPQISDCLKCSATSTCSYSLLFLGAKNQKEYIPTKFKNYSHIPNHYLIRTDDHTKTKYNADDIFSFRFHLFGTGIDFLMIWIQAFQDFEHYSPDTHSKAKLLLERVVSTPTEKSVYEQGHYYNPPLLKRCLFSGLPDICVLKLKSPLRFKSNGELISGIVDEKFFTNRMIERANLLKTFYGDCNALLAEHNEVISFLEHNAYWCEYSHRSSRQKSKLKMGGIKGSIIIRINDQNFSPLLHFTTYAGLGSYVTAGYGDMALDF